MCDITIDLPWTAGKSQILKEWLISLCIFWNTKVEDWMFGQVYFQEEVIWYNFFLFAQTLMNIFRGPVSKFQTSCNLSWWDAVWIDNFPWFLLFFCWPGLSLIAEENPCSLQVFKFPASLSSPCSAGICECGLVWVISKHFLEDVFLLCYVIIFHPFLTLSATSDKTYLLYCTYHVMSYCI